MKQLLYKDWILISADSTSCVLISTSNPCCGQFHETSILKRLNAHSNRLDGVVLMSVPNQCFG